MRRGRDFALIRWLRPEFQNPEGARTATQVSLMEAGLETPEPAKAAKGKKAAKLAWPKDLPSRVVAARDLLAELGEATADDFPRRFNGVQTDKAEKLLESLAAGGRGDRDREPGAAAKLALGR